MSKTFFTSVKKGLSVSTTEVRLTATEKNPETSVLNGIQRMTVEEYSVVAGGPQVENDPQL